VITSVQEHLKKLEKEDKHSEAKVYAKGIRLYEQASCQVLTHSKNYWDILISSFDPQDDSQEFDTEIRINFGGDRIYPSLKTKEISWTPEAVAALKEVEFILNNDAPKTNSSGKMYTREGMIKRVMD